MPATDDAGGLTEEEIDKACARAVISAKVAHDEARGYKIAAESFFEKCIEFKREIDAAFDVVCEQAREIARLRTRLEAAERVCRERGARLESMAYADFMSGVLTAKQYGEEIEALTAYREGGGSSPIA